MINHCMTLLTDELVADGVEDPLNQPFTLAAIWDDLCRHAGERPSAELQLRLGEQVAPIQSSSPITAASLEPAP